MKIYNKLLFSILLSLVLLFEINNRAFCVRMKITKEMMESSKPTLFYYFLFVFFNSL